MYVVFLTKVPVINDFASDYFPRQIRYKADALNLVAELHRKQGDGKVMALPKVTAKQEGGDDGYCYMVRFNGRAIMNGLTRSEVDGYKRRAIADWLNATAALLLPASSAS